MPRTIWLKFDVIPLIKYGGYLKGAALSNEDITSVAAIIPYKTDSLSILKVAYDVQR